MDSFNRSADQCSLSFHLTVVCDVLVADQLKLFILFYKTCWLLKQQPCPPRLRRQDTAMNICRSVAEFLLFRELLEWALQGQFHPPTNHADE